MRIACFAQIAPLLCLLAQAPVAAAGEGEPIVTRQTLFAIPFRIDQAGVPSREPVEVQLYVSGDRGAQWKLYAQAAPQQRQFVFRAGADGEYWFAIRTIDRSGLTRPEGDVRVGLRVIVDTTPPELRLEASRGAAGQIVARWEVRETNPRPQTLSIQYGSLGGAWQSVALGPQNHRGTDGPVQTGQVTWWPQGAADPIQVRAEVADAAGNIGVSHAQVDSISPRDTEPPPPTEDPLARNPFGDGWRPATRAQVAESAPAPPTPGAHAWPAVPAPPGAGTAQSPGSMSDGFGAPLYDRYAAPWSSASAPADPGLPASARPTTSPPALGRPRMVNSRRFEIDYDLAAADPRAVRRIELWATRDGGRNWYLLTVDPDAQSPVLASVAEEGLYGFRIVVVDASGAALPPQPGDRPDMWVAVDLTPPAVRILSATEGGGAEQGRLIVAWEAVDAMLATRPISIFRSDRASGPWVAMASGLENTGSAAIPLDPRLPRVLFLRIEARDEAGNTGVFETTEPLMLSAPAADLPAAPAAVSGYPAPAETRAQYDVAPRSSAAPTSPRRYYFR